MAGYISLNMPFVLQCISYISPLTYGCYILSNIVFQGEVFTCSSSERDSSGNCPLATGEEVLALYSMDNGSGPYGMYYHMIMLATVTVVIFVLTYIVMRARAYKISH